MRALVAVILAALLAGCCVGGYPPVWSSGGPPPFDAFHAGMRLAVGMPTDIAIQVIGWAPVSTKATTCGIAAGYEWPCQVLKFGCCEGNQLLVYVAPSPDGRGAMNGLGVGQGLIRATGRFQTATAPEFPKNFPRFALPVRGGANRVLTCFLAHDLLLLTAQYRAVFLKLTDTR